MGGYGSGRWQHEGAKHTCEASLCLSIAALRTIIGLDDGSRGTIKIGKNSIAYELRNRVLKLFYGLRGENSNITCSIRIEATQCHYGGDRYWFVCPRCLRHCAKLYLAQDCRFACRLCANLAYLSTRRPSKREIAERKQKRQERLMLQWRLIARIADRYDK